MRKFTITILCWLTLSACNMLTPPTSPSPAAPTAMPAPIASSATPQPTPVATASSTVAITTASAACEQTAYVSGHPPDANTATLTDTWYANEWLWAGLVPPFRGVWYAGGVKVGWWRSVSGRLTIAGKRLDAAAPALRADIPDGYGPSGFQSTGIDFPTEGCWEVVGSVGDKSLRFVVLVLPASENPTRAAATAQPTPAPSVAGLTNLKAPTAQPGSFWANDVPKELGPLAFSVLPRDNQPGQGVTVSGYELGASFPSFPHELDVYLMGDYPADHCSALLSIVKSLQDWDCIPFYSLVQYRGETALGEKLASPSQQQVEQRALQLLKERGLLMPDQSTPTARQNDDGTWRVWFVQRINSIPVYANKGLAVTFNGDGQARNIIGRRRPLLARSRYPLRTPEESWERFKQGKARSFYVDDLSRPHPGTVTRLTQIELAYAEVEVITAQQIMQPYYVFRADTGQTLYVPAVADPYVTWP
jgi:hypothetical protein